MMEQKFDVIDKALTFLQKTQQKNGEFISHSSRFSLTFVKEYDYHTPFLTSLIAIALSSTKKNNITKKISDFLIKQVSAQGTFNYWTKESPDRFTMPYPDDLDDTCCALSAIYSVDHNQIDGAMLSSVVRILTTQEITAGGPYRTWVVPKNYDKKWQDVDLAVNANINFFFSLLDVKLDKLQKFIDAHILQGSYYSKYYPRSMPIMYCIARGYNGNYSDRLKTHIQQELNYALQKKNTLDISLGVVALLHLGVVPSIVEKYICEIQESQQQNGSWKAFGICIDPSRKGVPYTAGSESLTTAICIEAISLFQQRKNKIKKDVAKKEKHEIQDKFISLVSKRVEERYLGIDKKSLSTMHTIIEKLQAEREIFLLAPMMVSAMEIKQESKINKIVECVSIASLHGWLAYRIYDDILDEKKNIELLPVANIALREIGLIYAKLCRDYPEIYKKYIFLMDEMEFASSWEVCNCRLDKNNVVPRQLPNFGDYGVLAQRSIGHAIGTLFLYRDAGGSPEELKSLEEFFRHYIIARQLNDDAHDWEEDLLEGRINSVGALLLKNESSVGAQVDVRLLHTLKKKFWHVYIGNVSAQVKKHCHLAQEALFRCRLVIHKDKLISLLTPLENAAQKAADEQQKMLSFLDAYKH